VPAPSRFDHYAEAVLSGNHQSAASILDPEERNGLKLFIGKGGCTNCHFGPLLTNSDFHNLLIPPSNGPAPDSGRDKGVREVLADEFNCLGEFSDAGDREECAELVFMDTQAAHHQGAFKTPSLRNVAERRFYMHAGQFETLDAVLAHYGRVGERVPELQHGALSAEEAEALKAFLKTLSSPSRILPPFDETIHPEPSEPPS
jgi:cytochrome c peroxidase